MKKLTKYINEIYICFRNETKIITKDFDIFLITSLAILIYGMIYSYSYGSEVLQKVPIAFVDMDNSVSSHEFKRKLGSTQNVDLKYGTTNFEQAKQLMLDKKVNGIVYIKRGFSKDINTNKTAYLSVYCDVSYFLAYKQFFTAVNHVMLDINKNIKYERYLMAGHGMDKASFMSQPVDTKGYFLYNTPQGYGGFLMPAILILIIQQTILIACSLVHGKIREYNMIDSVYGYTSTQKYSASSIVLGRSLFYLISNLVTWLLIIIFVYYIFQLPDNGSIWEIYALIIPYILSSTFLAIGISTLMRYRESAIIYIFFASLPFLLLSGISWPYEGMPEFWVMFAKLLPSTSAINGFTGLQSMGANISNIAINYSTLWVLTSVYFVFAVICYRLKITKRKH